MRSDRMGMVQFALLVATLLVIGVFVQTRSIDVDLHNRRMDLLLQLEQAEAQLDRDVRSVISFRLAQYDPFDAHTRTIRALALQLGSSELALSNKALIDAYVQSLDDKLVLMELIKSQAGLARNGLHYLTTAVAELGDRDRTIGLEVASLLNRLLHFLLFPSGVEVEQITEAFDDLEVFAEVDAVARPLFDNILFHLRANLRLMDELAGLRDRYGGVASDASFDAVYRDYTGRYAAQSRQAEFFTVVLLLVAVTLFIGLGIALYSTFKSRREAEQARDQMRSAVESLSEAFALFAPDGRLILHNRKFLEFYPWLDGELTPGTRLEDILERNSESGKFAGANAVDTRFRLPGPSLPCTGSQSYLEELTDGRWYLASDTCTKAGELACVRVDITASKRTEQELRKLYRALEQSPASVMITNTRGEIEYVNPKFEETTGYSAQEALGQNPRILKSGDKSREDYKELWDTIRAGKVWRGQFHNKRKDGEIYWEAASISPVRDSNGNITHFIAVKEDVTVQKRAEDQLRLNATVFDTTSEGIMVTDSDNRIKTVNPAFTRITGYLPEEAIGRDPRILSSGRHDRTFFSGMWKSLLGKGYWNGEIWNRRKDGSVYPEWLSLAAIKNSDGPAREYVAVFSDITQRKQNEEQIRRQADYDALTGLPNRFLLFDRLARALASARREPRIVALLFLDLDRFKVVNDTLGHVAGDELLQQVAERLKACMREADTVARFGGDEFVIILEDPKSAGDAAEVARKVIAALKQPVTVGGREACIGGSIGIALYPNDSVDAESMLRNADMAMYRSKDAGRNTYRFFTGDS